LFRPHFIKDQRKPRSHKVTKKSTKYRGICGSRRLEAIMAYPTDRKYTKEHEWIQASGNAATIGITDHAQESLGDIVFVELPKVGSELAAGKTFGTVESVKAVSDLFAPASGTVTEVNATLATSPEAVNKDAHGSWMLKITLKNLKELDSLLSAADYDKFVAEEGGH
jgi:glycine cleavage system H protein